MKRNQLQNLKRIALAIMLFVLGAQVSSKAQCTSTFSVTYDTTGSILEFFPAYTSTANPVSYQWSFGDGTASNVQQPTHTYNSVGYSLVCLTITFSDSCIANNCDTVLTRLGTTQTCNANFSASSTPMGVAFTDLSSTSDSILSYDWDFGDGTTGSGMNAFHAYTSNGTYVVCLTINSATGCTDTHCSTVTVQGAANCSAGFTSSAVLGTTVVDFTSTSIADSGATIISYSWNFGDSVGTSTLQNPSYTYAAPGIYWACLTIETSNGCINTSCNQVNAGGANSCTANFSSSFNPATNGVDFYDNSITNDSIVRYEWTFGDGSSSLDPNPTHQYATGGTYQVCLTITTAGGCTDVSCSNVIAPGSQTCNAAFTAQVTPAGTGVFYTTVSNAQALYSWSFGDGNTQAQIGASSVTHTYATPGTYLVCLVVSDSSCADSSCNSITIGASSACAALFTYVVDSTGTQFSFTNQSSPISSTNVFFWSFGDGTGSNDENPIHIYNSAGPHSVCLTVIDSINGCSDTFCNSASLANACNPVFSSVPDTSNPAGVPMNFNIISPCGTTNIVTIDFGDGTVQTGTTGIVQYSYTTPGNYNVCICAVDLLGDTICFCDTIVAYRLTSGISDPELANIHLSAYPNPFSSALNAEFTLEQNAVVSVQLIGLAGNIVLQSQESKYAAGTHRFEINTNDLASGFYILRLNVNGMQASKKVTLQK